MKKLVYAFGFLVMAALAHSAVLKNSFIGPATSTGTSSHGNHLAATGGGTPDVLLPSAGTGLKNCLSYLHVGTSASITLRVLNGGATFYQVQSSSNTPIIAIFSSDENALCGSNATSMSINVSTNAPGGPYNINYGGFTY